jgi:hypothetical protein
MRNPSHQLNDGFWSKGHARSRAEGSGERTKTGVAGRLSRFSQAVEIEAENRALRDPVTIVAVQKYEVYFAIGRR